VDGTLQRCNGSGQDHQGSEWAASAVGFGAQHAEEYEVFYTVEYSVTSGGTELIPRQKLELTRDYSYDTTAVLAKEREQAVLREALAQDLAGLVLRRLASL
jgi:LPS-assembly lipoprotein